MELEKVEQEIVEELHKPKTWLEILLAIVVLALIFYGVSEARTKSVPDSFSLDIPFTPQAPFGNWAGNENCEETSLTMANAYLNGDTRKELPATEAQQQIQRALDWENENLGHNADTGADETAKMAKEVFNLKSTKIFNYSDIDLKRAISKHNVVLLMINAPTLDSGQYPVGGGAGYHVVVLRGYNGDTFYINDPGTTGGENKAYSFDTIKKAAADWSGRVDFSRKVALVLYK